MWIALNEGRVLSVLEVGPELRERAPTDPPRKEGCRHLPRRVLEPVALAVGDGAVWALERGRGELNRIDPATGVAEPLADGLGGSSSIAVASDAVWLGGPDGVIKLDLATGLELERTPVDEVPESRTTSIAVGRDAVWFVGDSSERLWRINPRNVDDPGIDPDRGEPECSGRRGGRGRLGREQRSHLALAPGTGDRRRRPNRGRHDFERARRRLRPDLDEPGKGGRVAARFTFRGC